MYPITIAGDYVDLAQLDEAAANERLQVAKNTKATVHCLCLQSRGLPPPPKPLLLKPVRRGIDYHLRREKYVGHLHYEDCRHHTFSVSQLAFKGYAPEALHSGDEGELHISLDFGIGDSDDRDKAVRTISYRHTNGRDLETRTRASLLGLLHLWWTSADLNRFDPYREPANGPWERVRQVARRTHPNQMRSLRQYGLSSILLLPTEAHPDQRRRNYAKLTDTYKKRRVMFIGQLDPYLLENRNAGGYADMYKMFGVGLSLHGDLITRMLQQFPTERVALAAGAPVIVFGLAKVRQRRNGDMAATVERIALMGVTDWYVPVESSHERLVAEYLEASARAYLKPLRHDASELVHPDFVLLDTPTRVPLEIYGMSSHEYLARKNEKQNYYAVEFPGKHWQWEALVESLDSALQRLPMPWGTERL